VKNLYDLVFVKKFRLNRLVLLGLACLFVLMALIGMSGCTMSVGAETRAFYPADKSPRKGFYDAGGMDGIYSRPSTGSFATLGGTH